MIKKAMVLLIGEQPAPNLLPVRHLKPDVAVLAYTDRTQRVAENLEVLLKPDSACLRCPVEPYNVTAAQEQLRALLESTLTGYEFVFNLTGGTKLMALAALGLAHIYRAPFIYLQTTEHGSRLYHYVLEDGEIRRSKVEDLATTISLDDYLRMHLGAYEVGEPRNDLEHQVREALRSSPELEVFWSVRPQGLGALEIDFAVRLGNQVGVGEVKTKGDKSGIDQINAVAEQRHLGTYVRKFLISGKKVDSNNRELAKAYAIEVIELSSYSEIQTLSERDRQQLVRTVVARLSGTRKIA